MTKYSAMGTPVLQYTLLLTLGCQDAYYRKSAAVPLLTQHNYHTS